MVKKTTLLIAAILQTSVGFADDITERDYNNKNKEVITNNENIIENKSLVTQPQQSLETQSSDEITSQSNELPVIENSLDRSNKEPISSNLEQIESANKLEDKIEEPQNKPVTDSLPLDSSTPARTDQNNENTNTNVEKKEMTALDFSLKQVDQPTLKEEKITSQNLNNKDKNQGGLINNLDIGLRFSLISVPHPLELGLELKFFKSFSFSLEKTFLPKIAFSLPDYETDIAVKVDSQGVKGKVFPFKGSFFIGAGLGEQKIEVDAFKNINLNVSGSVNNVPFSQNVNIPTDVSCLVSISYFTPHIGWQWVSNSGFFMGVDFGWRIATKTTSNIDLNPHIPYNELPLGVSVDEIEQTVKNSQIYKENKQKAEDEINKNTKIGLPSVSLIQLGWFF